MASRLHSSVQLMDAPVDPQIELVVIDRTTLDRCVGGGPAWLGGLFANKGLRRPTAKSAEAVLRRARDEYSDIVDRVFTDATRRKFTGSAWDAVNRLERRLDRIAAWHGIY